MISSSTYIHSMKSQLSWMHSIEFTARNTWRKKDMHHQNGLATHFYRLLYIVLIWSKKASFSRKCALCWIGHITYIACGCYRANWKSLVTILLVSTCTYISLNRVLSWRIWQKACKAKQHAMVKAHFCWLSLKLLNIKSSCSLKMVLFRVITNKTEFLINMSLQLIVEDIYICILLLTCLQQVIRTISTDKVTNRETGIKYHQYSLSQAWLY